MLDHMREPMMNNRKAVLKAQDLYNQEALNEEFTFQEVSRAVDYVKNGKAYLSIPNDALKNIDNP